MSDVTTLLKAAAKGDQQAAQRLMEVVYEELRRLARAKMMNEKQEWSLQATALVHEAWLRLGADSQPAWGSRGHFFSAAAEAMRRILIEAARKRSAQKRGGNSAREDFDDIEIQINDAANDRTLLINEALEEFEKLDPRKAELVKLRYFAGLSFEECSMALGVAVPTAKGWWAYSRAWLKTRMQESRESQSK
jgi:RNA polymerase sigma factor (TIGR02999 family)